MKTMKTMKTTVACSLLCLLSATVRADEAANIAAYEALKEQPGFSPGSQEVDPIVAAIEAQATISAAESSILYRYYVSRGGEAAWQSASERLETKSPRAAANVKWVTRDASGWTPEMVQEGNWDAVRTALYAPSAGYDFKAEVFSAIKGKLLVDSTQKKFFKAFRATLPKDQQIEATQKQRDFLLAKLDRTNEDNAWLTEMLADLVALEVDAQ